ncbi:malate synthase A [Gulosibacter sp. 10]|uniref:malate synthase A n=1 Tax=Gulosibacter sp. 10 TaxID=1255570 RepID=UPI00097EBF92|nr:malate synthase A [Gulosibacter sp. 10]SJM69500.1 Malate synthase [Gulosibacter sp. 10]
MTITITDPNPCANAEDILTDEALAFVEALHERFGARVPELLQQRAERRDRISRTGTLDFRSDTAHIRESDWQVAPIPEPFADRRVEITGPASPEKMAINALNAGAKVWLACLEDASSPTWHNVIDAQVNLKQAASRRMEHTSPEGKQYRLREDGGDAIVVVRPRGWHLPERHVRVDGGDAVAAFVDFGLHFFHNAKTLTEQGRGPFYYLAKLEASEEARLWNDVFSFAEEYIGIPHGTVRSTVLIETITAAFEMDEILYELREHAAGLNAGRWDYLFSFIKNFRDAGEGFVLPDRADVSMTAPFMRAYTELLVKTCHRRGAFAIGGMAAFIPDRNDPEKAAQAFEKVRADKRREANDGFDGSWVAHPALVPIAQEVFDDVLGAKPNQIDRKRPEVEVTAQQLLDVSSAPGRRTEEGLKDNLYVATWYIAVWLQGNGAVAIHNLMEDAATAEISRSQVWQQLNAGTVLEDTGSTVTVELVNRLLDEQLEVIRGQVDEDAFTRFFSPAGELVRGITTSEEYVDFLTLPAYDIVCANEAAAEGGRA